MEIGYRVSNLNQLDSALQWGFDYAEFDPHGIGFEAGVAQAEAIAKRLESSPLAVKSLYRFIADPGQRGLTVVGPDRNPLGLQQYVAGLFTHMQQAGVEMIGCGGDDLCGVPDGFEPGRAREQVRDFLEICGDLGEAHDVTTTLGPCVRDDANVLNTVPDACELVREIGHPRIRLMVDFSSMKLNGESFDALHEAGPYLAHAHIAEPGAGPPTYPSDHSDYLYNLRLAGFDGRLTLNGNLSAYVSPAEAALSLRTAASAPL